MKYRVVFHPLADHSLVELWSRSAQRQRVTQAVDWLEAQLTIRPHDMGESRTANDRILFERPVGMKFRIDDSKHEVLVVEVWEVRKRGG